MAENENPTPNENQEPTPSPAPEADGGQAETPPEIQLEEITAGNLPSVCPAWKTIVCGVVVCTVLATILIYGLSSMIAVNWMIKLVCATFVFVGVGYLGLIDVDIQHKAVLQLFGERRDWFLLSEGTNWLPPRPLMDAVIVDMRERVLRIGETYGKDDSEAKPLIVASIATGEDSDWKESEEGDQTKPTPVDIKQRNKEEKKKRASGDVRLVQMIVRVTIFWVVENPFRFLNIGEKRFEGALIDLAVKTLREKAATLNDILFIQSAGDLEKEIIAAINDDVDSRTKEQIISLYGTRIRRVTIPKIVHESPDMVSAYESVAREKRQRQAETLEREFLVTTIRALKKEGLTAKDAILTIQAERGKSTRREVVITSDRPLGDMATAATLLPESSLGKGLGSPPRP